MLLKEIKNIFHIELREIYPKEEINSFFYLLIAHYLGLEKFILAIRPNFIVSKEEEQPLFEALSELRVHRPIQYITGTAHFMDLDFIVNKNVLIPRPETEELVQWILRDENVGRTHSKGELRILDIGTGSGCIAISLAKILSGGKIIALDISEGALEVAKHNAEKLGVEIEFKKADIFEIASLSHEFDIIVSNPPYVRESEKEKMQPNVLEYEPIKALFVPDDDALKYYEAIAVFARKNLTKNGKLFLEINQYLAKETRQLLEAHNFMDIEIRKDLFGNDRMLKARFSKTENEEIH